MNVDILYLDFDGVLHPDEAFLDANGRVYLRVEGQLLEHAALLAEILAPFPNIKIVLSTSWVRMKSYSWVRRRLPETLRQRTIGATWHSGYARDSMEIEWWRDASRYRQILRDVQRRSPSRWLALDDDVEDWPQAEMHRVVLCDPTAGLSSVSTQSELIERLKTMSSANLGSMRFHSSND